jgi:predicted YcjX-like family ATPase
MAKEVTPPKRRGRGPARMTEELVRKIHKDWKSGESYTVLAKKYNIAKSTISEAFYRYDLREPRTSKYPEALVRKMHKHWLQSKSYKETSEKFQVPRPVLWANFRKLGLQTAIYPRDVPKQRYSREDAVKFHDFWKKNGYKLTAETFKVPHQSLWSLFRRFDLSTTHRTGKK